jgi:hypothetical protein
MSTRKRAKVTMMFMNKASVRSFEFYWYQSVVKSVFRPFVVAYQVSGAVAIRIMMAPSKNVK